MRKLLCLQPTINLANANISFKIDNGWMSVAETEINISTTNLSGAYLCKNKQSNLQECSFNIKPSKIY